MFSQDVSTSNIQDVIVLEVVTFIWDFHSHLLLEMIEEVGGCVKRFHWEFYFK